MIKYCASGVVPNKRYALKGHLLKDSADMNMNNKQVTTSKPDIIIIIIIIIIIMCRKT